MKVVIIALFVISASFQSIGAQENEPQVLPVVEGVPSRALVDVFFPEAIRFEWRVAQTADQLRDLELTIRYNELQSETIRVDEANILFREPETVVVIYWRIPLDDPPDLFSDVRYRWSGLDAAQGMTVYEDVVRWQDTRVEWERGVLEALVLYAPAETRPTPSALMTEFRPLYTLAQANTGRSPRLEWLAYRSPVSPFCYAVEGRDGPVIGTPRLAEAIDCRQDAAERVLSGYDLISFQAETQLYDQVLMRLVGAFYPELFSRTDVPAWFRLGLIELYDARPKDVLLVNGAALARAGTAYGLGEMIQAPPDVTRGDPWFGQAYGMLLLLVERVGFAGLFDLAGQLETGADFDAAVSGVAGVSPQALIPIWERWVVSGRAVSVFALSPYQPATATPAPSATPTFTRTATLTPTPTATVTPTPTGVLSPTPFNTATLTPSVTSAPSTATPRPPGSLVTPTPVVEPSAAPTSDASAGRWMILIGLGAALIILIVLFIRSGTRRW